MAFYLLMLCFCLEIMNLLLKDTLFLVFFLYSAALDVHFGKVLWMHHVKKFVLVETTIIFICPSHEKIFDISEQNGDEWLRQPANILRERMQRCVKLLLSMDQAGSVITNGSSFSPRFTHINHFISRMVCATEIPWAGKREFV